MFDVLAAQNRNIDIVQEEVKHKELFIQDTLSIKRNKVTFLNYLFSTGILLTLSKVNVIEIFSVSLKDKVNF